MSIQNLDEVDLIGVNKAIGRVELAIIDDLDWNDVKSHLLILQDKVNAYLGFIESGQIYESYPEASSFRPVIQVLAQYSLPKEGREFMEKLKIFLDEVGYDFEFKMALVRE
ncbi:hypothetical protein QGP82_14050 [Leptothoe sp. LEGE 181152]|nr:hypothetical protein [Leptothoe sp. LEGE 181152]